MNSTLWLFDYLVLYQELHGREPADDQVDHFVTKPLSERLITLTALHRALKRKT